MALAKKRVAMMQLKEKSLLENLKIATM